jgi:hypothetical protein
MGKMVKHVQAESFFAADEGQRKCKIKSAKPDNNVKVKGSMDSPARLKVRHRPDNASG